MFAKDAKVVQRGSQWCVESEDNPDWSGGCYPTKGEAESRLGEVEYFKSKGSAMRKTAEIIDELVPDEQVEEEQVEEEQVEEEQAKTAQGYGDSTVAVNAVSKALMAGGITVNHVLQSEGYLSINIGDQGWGIQLEQE